MKKENLKKCHAIALAATLTMSAFAAGPLSLIQPVSAAAALSTVYVDSTNGKDTNNGSSKSKAYKTIGKAAESVADKGTIKIVGTYSCDNSTNKYLGAADKHITISGCDSGSTLDISSAKYVFINGPTTLSNLNVSANEYGYIYANGNAFTIDGSVDFDDTTQYCIYGGTNSSSTKEVTSTWLTLNAGNFYRIFGGSLQRTINGDTHVYIGGNVNQVIEKDKKSNQTILETLHEKMNIETTTVDGKGYRFRYDLYGGSCQAEVNGNTYVEINGENTLISSIVGGCTWSGSKAETTPGVQGTSSVCLKKGVVYSIFGGSCGTASKDTAATNTNVTVTGGSVAQVFGGSLSGTLTGSTQVLIAGGTIARRVYAGCYNDVENKAKADQVYHVNGSTFLAMGHNVNLNYNEDKYDNHLDNVISACSRSEKSFSDETSTMWISPVLYTDWFDHEGVALSRKNDYMLRYYNDVQLMLRDVPKYSKTYFKNMKGKPYYLIDLNGDKITDAEDVELLKNYIGKSYKDDIDVNGDGKINETDVNVLNEFVQVKITGQPANVTKLLNEDAIFAVTASGTGLTYQWQYNDGKGWKDFTSSDSKTASITVAATAASNGYKYRCVINSFNGTSVTSSAATLTVQVAKITYKANGGSGSDAVQEYAPGKAVKLKSADTFTREGYTFNGWNSKADGSGNSYAADQEVTWKNNVTLYAQWKPVQVKITQQPKSVRVNALMNASFTVTAVGTNLTYQWQYNDGNGWKNIDTGRASTLTVRAINTNSGYLYRCIVTSSNGTRAVSSSAVLTVASVYY